MLTPEYLAQLPEPVIKLWQQVEDDILRDIARRIAKMDGLTESAAYQAYRLEQTRILRQDIVKLLAKYSGKTEAAIRKLMQEAATETIRSEDVIHAAAGTVLPAPNNSPNLLNLLNSGYTQTIGTWKNLTATTANTVTKQFENALDRAWLQVNSGAFDYQTAIKRAIDDLSQHMDGVTYPTGHHDTLEVAVRRAVLTGVNQTCAKLQWERIKEAGCEFVEVTAHAGARDDGEGPANHAGWQGKVYHIGGAIWYKGHYYEDFETVTGYGTGPGLCGWNCRHNFHAFYPGISVPAYSDELLASYTARNIEYNGKMYTQYEINQMQRALERNVRKNKLLWMAEREAGLDSTTAAFKLKNSRKKLNDFVKATGGRVDSSRTAAWSTSTLPGKKFGRSESSKANWDVRSKVQDAAKFRDSVSIYPPLKGDAITHRSLHNNLAKSEIGKETIEYITSGKCSVEINYTDEAPKGVRGKAYAHNIAIYAKNTRTIKATASTLVHEVTHVKYGIGGSQYAEAVCFAREHIHEHGTLTTQDLRNIIKEVKELYPEYEWRKGGRNKWKK